jgi:hypothetical protein
MTRRRAAGWLALALWAAGTGGCRFSDAPPVSGSMEEATVKGTVRVRGKPVTNGVVSFRCSNINRPKAEIREAPIGKDGTYTVKTLVGQNFVEVSCKETLSPKNRDLIENEQMVEIRSGENTLDIDIPPKAPAAAK